MPKLFVPSFKGFRKTKYLYKRISIFKIVFTAPSPIDPQNKPVYMEDLQKALTDLEKKLEQKQAAIKGGKHI